jgi:hypothetical protein
MAERTESKIQPLGIVAFAPERLKKKRRLHPLYQFVEEVDDDKESNQEGKGELKSENTAEPNTPRKYRPRAKTPEEKALRDKRLKEQRVEGTRKWRAKARRNKRKRKRTYTDMS